MRITLTIESDDPDEIGQALLALSNGHFSNGHDRYEPEGGPQEPMLEEDDDGFFVEDLSAEEIAENTDFIVRQVDPEASPNENLARSQDSLADMQAKLLGEDHPTVQGLREHAAALREEDFPEEEEVDEEDPEAVAHRDTIEAVLSRSGLETLRFIRNYPEVSVAFVAEKLALENGTANGRLCRLVEQGAAERVGHGHYRAVI